MTAEINNSTIVRNFNTPLSILYETTMHKINKETEELNNSLYKLDLTDFYRELHQQQQNIHSSQVLMEHSPG